VTITCALASCEPVAALNPTYEGELVFEVEANVPDYGPAPEFGMSVEEDSAYGPEPEQASIDENSAYGPAPGSEHAGGEGHVDEMRFARQTLRTGTLVFTVPEALVADDPALRTAELESAMGDAAVIDGFEVCAPGAQAPVDDVDGMSMAAPTQLVEPPRLNRIDARIAASQFVLPEPDAEIESLKAEIEAGLGRPLDAAELELLTVLVMLRVGEMQKLALAYEQRVAYDQQIAEQRAKQEQIFNADIYATPSIWEELSDSFWSNTGPGGIVEGAWDGFKAMVSRSD
jgi:hypothetical protein